MNLSPRILFMLLSVCAINVNANERIDANWLYLSSGGSWIERIEAFDEASWALPLPVVNLQPEEFWWHAANPQTQLSWRALNLSDFPAVGTEVEMLEDATAWQVDAVTSSYLLLSRDDQQRYLPQTEWHRLGWAKPDRQTSLQLQVTQAQAGLNRLQYAWLDRGVRAEVRYRIIERGGKSSLQQELVLFNQTDVAMSAAGYSYAQTENRPVMRLSLALESAATSAAVPSAGESQGIPTLVSAEAVMLPAQSTQWLVVANTKLSNVERQYEMTWDTRSQGRVNAQMSLRLESNVPLPELAGTVQIGVFDRQLPMLNSFYQPEQPNEAELSLGTSPLVSMNATLIRPGVWQLDISNRSNDSIELDLTINHRVDQTVQQVPLTVEVGAESSEMFELRQQPNGRIGLLD